MPDTESGLRPLRILIGCDTFAPDVNGSAKFVERLAAGLIDRGHTVHIVAPSPIGRPYEGVEEHAGHRVFLHRWTSWKYLGHPWLRFALPWRIHPDAARLLDQLRPDVVHSQSHIMVGAGLTRAARQRGVRLVATNHIMPENLLQFVPVPGFVLPVVDRFQWNLAQRVLELADAVTTPTRRAAEYLEQHTTIRDVRAISCGLRVDDYTAVIGPRDDAHIVFVGRVEEEKQLDKLLRALQVVVRSRPEAHLEIVGDGDARPALEQLRDELGLADAVTFAGRVSDEQLRAALTRATVFAMPSIAELQSIATMEALASGLPVVAADAMALPHLVHDGENGFLFPPGDVDAFAARLLDVLGADADAYTAMQRASLEIVADHDIERTLDVFEALYRGHPVTEEAASVDLVAGVASEEPSPEPGRREGR